MTDKLILNISESAIINNAQTPNLKLAKGIMDTIDTLKLNKTSQKHTSNTDTQDSNSKDTKDGYENFRP
jgi:hypothetical protein